MKRNLIVLSCLLVFPVFTVSQAMAVQVWGEGAYTDMDVQVCIYANTESDALRSFGVRLIYDSSELTYDPLKITRNEADWYLTDGNGTQYDYQEPEDVEEQGSDRAVVIIGGVLDPGKVPDKVSGSRVLLGTVWFTRDSGSGALTHALALGLGKGGDYANFARGPEEGDVLDSAILLPITVAVHERGDANADGTIDGRDIRALHGIIGSEDVPCWCDCNNDGVVDGRDIRCLRQII